MSFRELELEKCAGGHANTDPFYRQIPTVRLRFFHLEIAVHFTRNIFEQTLETRGRRIDLHLLTSTRGQPPPLTLLSIICLILTGFRHPPGRVGLSRHLLQPIRKKWRPGVPQTVKASIAWRRRCWSECFWNTIFAVCIYTVKLITKVTCYLLNY